MAKLKVFCWSDGFRAYPVAVSSRPKALEAWGATQDLFKTGMATELTEGADFEAALAAPGEVLERRLAIKLEGGAAKAGKPAKAVVRETPQGPTKAQLATVAKAEAALAALEAKQASEREAAEAVVTKAEAALDEARAHVRMLASRQRKMREAAEAALSEAKDAIRG